ncbi:MAG TPA: hypothetical protein VJ723_12860 [Candidatus Angelobacter sp.]|nr:hypothetical protein [Candidatus Angelobacter sp.]
MTLPLQSLVSKLESRLPELERQRSLHPFANDMFEAVDDLSHLGAQGLENSMISRLVGIPATPLMLLLMKVV